ncbi:MAG TPA: hypothetical protein VK054_12945, partial [Beutenbergiaceae bacterium]|nr:hypothetical protein [Beutenbergiaceae bacterium]
HGENTQFYDLCCGSGAISIELVNRGINPTQITMVDMSSWGAFWAAIGSGEFNTATFDALVNHVPEDKHHVKFHMQTLAAQPLDGNEAELYPVLQAASFGGKQIWHNGTRWENAFFRDYWKPTPTSVRRSPANPMQPSPTELRRRVVALATAMKGVRGLKADVMTMLHTPLPADAIVYVDPPYQDTTAYAYAFDVIEFATRFREINHAPLYVSEGKPLSDDAVQLAFGGAKGGIAGSRAGKHQEWLSRF